MTLTLSRPEEPRSCDQSTQTEAPALIHRTPGLRSAARYFCSASSSSLSIEYTFELAIVSTLPPPVCA